MNSLPYTILYSNEFYTSSKRIHGILTSTLTDNSYVTSLCSLLGTGISDMEKALGKALKSEFTPVLFQKDAERDSAYLGLRNFIKSYVHSRDSVKAGAAIKLLSVIENAGNNIYRLGYVDETAKLNALILSLKAGEMAQALQTTGATEWFQEMETAQLEFEKAYKEKVDMESAIDYPLLKDSKNRIAKTLKALLSFVESNAELTPAQYKPVEEKINEVITSIVSITRARITRVENEKKQVVKGKYKGFKKGRLPFGSLPFLN